MKPKMLLPLRNSHLEVIDDVLRLKSGEINQIGQLTRSLAYKLIDDIGLDDAEVMPIGESDMGTVYAYVRIMPEEL